MKMDKFGGCARGCRPNEQKSLHMKALFMSNGLLRNHYCGIGGGG